MGDNVHLEIRVSSVSLNRQEIWHGKNYHVNINQLMFRVADDCVSGHQIPMLCVSGLGQCNYIMTWEFESSHKVNFAQTGHTVNH